MIKECETESSQNAVIKMKGSERVLDPKLQYELAKDLKQYVTTDAPKSARSVTV